MEIECPTCGFSHDAPTKTCFGCGGWIPPREAADEHGHLGGVGAMAVALEPDEHDGAAATTLRGLLERA